LLSRLTQALEDIKSELSRLCTTGSGLKEEFYDRFVSVAAGLFQSSRSFVLPTKQLRMGAIIRVGAGREQDARDFKLSEDRGIDKQREAVGIHQVHRHPGGKAGTQSGHVPALHGAKEIIQVFSSRLHGDSLRSFDSVLCGS
jgi:hypothetical protein